MKEIGSPSSLRRRILGFVSVFVLLSLLGSTVSLYRITEVTRILDAINQTAVPLSRLFAQVQPDADIFRKELEHGLGYTHWNDPHWNPHPSPSWIKDILENEIGRIQRLVNTQSDWTSPESRARWQLWAQQLLKKFQDINTSTTELEQALLQKNEKSAEAIYPSWNAAVDDWRRDIQRAAADYEQTLGQTFSLAESRTAELRTGLELVLIVVVLLSLLFLWLGERALRPLAELTTLAREITRRGLRKEDKSLLPLIPLSRKDEVSGLAREFHHMATALLEREKTVETQKNRLQEQNRLLKEIGELNETILKSIDSILIVTDMDGNIRHCNPAAISWLGSQSNLIIGTRLLEWPRMKPLIKAGAKQGFERACNNAEVWRIDPCTIDGRIYGGHLMPLKRGNRITDGTILVLEDLTQELDLQERLRTAENMAAVGRVSAQVAHEVRNPLHSIGLEAEMASEMASKLGSSPLKQSLQSILMAVDRLEKITQNYLKFSKLSAGEKTEVDIGEVLESVLATYSPVCEAQGIRVDWKQDPQDNLRIIGDRDLIEQALGNLFQNALQALEDSKNISPANPNPFILWTLENTGTSQLLLRIEDNGPGIPPEIQPRLFTPFVTSKAQGTGLGLSFVKKVMSDHKGTVTYVQNRKNGACFELVFPATKNITKHIAKNITEYLKEDKDNNIWARPPELEGFNG